MVGSSNNETNFPHKLLLTNRQILSLKKSFNNHTSADIKFSKAQLSKTQKGGFLKIYSTIIKVGIAFIKICN